MSRRRTRPDGPVPVRPDRSSPASWASFRTSGEMTGTRRGRCGRGHRRRAPEPEPPVPTVVSRRRGTQPPSAQRALPAAGHVGSRLRHRRPEPGGSLPLGSSTPSTSRARPQQGTAQAATPGSRNPGAQPGRGRNGGSSDIAGRVLRHRDQRLPDREDAVLRGRAGRRLAGEGTGTSTTALAVSTSAMIWSALTPVARRDPPGDDLGLGQPLAEVGQQKSGSRPPTAAARWRPGCGRRRAGGSAPGAAAGTGCRSR